MNRIYKVIWNEAKHCHVVASELAKGHTKSNTGKNGTGRGGLSLIIAALLMGIAVFSGAGQEAGAFTILPSIPSKYAKDWGEGKFDGLAYGDENGKKTINILLGNQKHINGGYFSDWVTALAGDETLSRQIIQQAPEAYKDQYTYSITSVKKAPSGESGSYSKTTEYTLKTLKNGKETGDAQTFTDTDTDTHNKVQSISLSGTTLTVTDADGNTAAGDLGGLAVHDVSINNTDKKNTADDKNYENGGATGIHSVAIGVNASATAENAVAIGTDAKAEGTGSVVFGKYARTGTKASGAFAAGGSNIDYTVHSASYKEGEADPDGKTFSGVVTASGKASAALGVGTEASGGGSVALGGGSKASGLYSTAMGAASEASNTGAVSIGWFSKAEGLGSTAFGYSTDASGGMSVAMGNSTRASAQNATAMGRETLASGVQSTAMGYGTKATGSNSTAMGWKNISSGPSSTSFGQTNKASGTASLAFGHSNEAQAVRSTAFGYGTQAAGDMSTTFGMNTKAYGPASTAFGKGTIAFGDSNVAFGSNTVAGGSKADENGVYTVTTTDNGSTVSHKVNSQGYEAYENNGTTYKAAVGNTSYTVLKDTNGKPVIYENDGKVYNVTISGTTVTVGNETTEGTQLLTQVSGSNISNATAFGAKTEASGKWSTAFGYDSTASNQMATAFGQASNASGYAATAFGYYTNASGYYSTAFGWSSTASGSASVAFGYNAKASGSYSVAFGNGSAASGENSLAALGGITSDKAVNAAAIGYDAKATIKDSIALGSGAETTNSGTVSGYDPQAKAVSSEDGITWKSKKAAIAIGSSTVSRQITGVAAGRSDTDAVNVAQLRRVNRTLQVNGSNTEAGTDYNTSGNLLLKANQAATSETTYDIKLNNNLSGINSVTGLADLGENSDGSSAANKNYVDTSVAARADKDLSNITADGKQVITGLTEVTNGSGNVTVDSTVDSATGKKTYTVSVAGNGTVKNGDTGLVTGDTVYQALEGREYTAGNGIAISDTRTISAKAKENGGIEVSTDGIAVKAKENGGITIDENGLSVNTAAIKSAIDTDTHANIKSATLANQKLTITDTDSKSAEVDLSGLYTAGSAINISNGAIRVKTTDTNSGLNASTDGLKVVAKENGGIIIDENGLSVNTDAIKGAIDTNTVTTVSTDNTLTMSDSGTGNNHSYSLSVKTKASGGLSADTEGLAVKAKENGGITIDENGLSVNTEAIKSAIDTDTHANIKEATLTGQTLKVTDTDDHSAEVNLSGLYTAGKAININDGAIGVKTADTNSGLNTTDGLKVVTKENGGITIDENGLSVNTAAIKSAIDTDTHANIKEATLTGQTLKVTDTDDHSAEVDLSGLYTAGSAINIADGAIGVKTAAANSGLDTADGLKVKAKRDGGITIDENGLSVNTEAIKSAIDTDTVTTVKGDDNLVTVTDESKGQRKHDYKVSLNADNVKGLAKEAVTITGDKNIIATQDTADKGKYTLSLGNTLNIGTGDQKVTIDGTNGHVTGLTNKDWTVGETTAVSGRAATEDQLKNVSDVVNKNKTAIATNQTNITKNAGDITTINGKLDGAVMYDKSSDNSSYDKTKITLGGQGGTTITNVKDGTLNENSKDAVNGSQLYATNQNVASNTQSISSLNTTVEKGLNFEGDTADSNVNKKLGDTLTIKGGAAGELSDGNIGVVKGTDGDLQVKLAKTLTGLTSVTSTNITGDNVTVKNSIKVGGEGGIVINKNSITNLSDLTDASDGSSVVNKNYVDSRITNVTSAASDYQLTARTDGYTLDENGDVSLEVKDSKHADAETKTVTIKGLASKSALDSLTDRAVQYDLKDTTVDKTKVTLAGEGGTTITNVKDGALNENSKDAVNGSQLYATNQNVASNTANISTNKTNIETNANNIAGNTSKINQNITNIASNKTAIEGNTAKITQNTTNISTNTQGISSLNTTVEKGLNFEGDTADSKVNKKLGDTLTIKGGAAGELSDGNIGVVKGTDGDLQVKLAKTLTGLTSVTSTNITGDNVTVKNSIKVGGEGGIVINKNSITNLSDLTDASDGSSVVNKNYVDSRITNVTSAASDYQLTARTDGYTLDENGDVSLEVKDSKHADAETKTVTIKGLASKSALDSLTDRAVQYDLKDTTVDKTKVTLAGEGGTTITNVKDGALSESSKDAVNGSQLYATNQNVASNTTDISNLKNLSNITKEGQTVIKNLAKGSIKVIDGQHTTVTKGSEGDIDTYAVNVTVDGKIEKDDKGIVNGGTVYNAIDAAKTEITNTTHAALDGKANVDASNIGSNLKDKDGNTASDELIKANQEAWGTALGGGSVSSGDTRLVTGGTVYTEVRPGQDGNYIRTTNTTGQNLTALDNQVKANADQISTNTTNISNLQTKANELSADLSGKANIDASNINTDKWAEKLGTGEVKEGDRNLVNGGTVYNALKDVSAEAGRHTTVEAGDKNISVTKDTDDSRGANYSVSLAKDISVETAAISKSLTVGGNTVISGGSVKVGSDVTVNDKGLSIKNGPSVTKEGIDAGGKTITHVGPGREADDAVNVGQINAFAGAVADNMNQLDRRINRAGAGASALAALHPLDFDPDDKWNIAVGYGNYKNANATALGLFVKPNENTLFSVGGAFGGGENMVNAGVSIRLGQGSGLPSGKAAMASEIRTLRGTVTDLNSKIQELEEKDRSRDEQMKKQSEQIEELLKQMAALKAAQK